MKVTTKNISETKVEITVTLDKNDLQTAKEQAVARLAKEVNVQGFRKGKVPAEIAEKHINPNDLASTTADIAVRRTVPMAFSEAKKAPLMIPNVEITKFVPDETLEYKAEADILPDIKLGDFKKLKVKKRIMTASSKLIADSHGIKGFTSKIIPLDSASALNIPTNMPKKPPKTIDIKNNNPRFFFIFILLFHLLDCLLSFQSSQRLG